jgi:Tol biopolymer transport system component
MGSDGAGFREVYRKIPRGMQPVLGWAPDGNHFLASVLEADGSNMLVNISVADGSARKLKNVGPLIPSPAKFSPDGKYVAYSSRKDITRRQPEDEVHILAVDGSYEGKLAERPAGDLLLDWAADGRHILFLSERHGAPGIYAIAVSEGKPHGEPVLVKQDAGQIRSASMTKDGALLYSLGGNSRSEMFTVNLDPVHKNITSDPRPISDRPVDERVSAAWSADGRRLAYVSSRVTRHETSLTIRTLESKQEREFPLPYSEPQTAGYLLSWAHDGSAIYTVFSENKTATVLSVSTTTGAVTRVGSFQESRQLGSLVTSQDGKALLIGYYDRPSRERRAVIRLDLASGRETEVASSESGEVAISPEGTREATLEIGPAGKSSIRLKPLDGGDWKTITTFEGTVGSGSNAPLFLRWTADGRSLLLLSENPGPSAVLYRIAAEGGNPEMLGKLSGLQHAHMFSVHPDGTQGLFHSVVTRTELWALENFLPKQQRAAK